MADKAGETARMTEVENFGNHTLQTPPAARRPFLQRLQKSVYLFLEWPRTVLSIIYHILLFIACLSVFCIAIFLTLPEFKKYRIIGANSSDEDSQNGSTKDTMAYVLAAMEGILQLWIIVDFALRVWSSGCRRCFQGWLGKLRFGMQFLSIIDILVIITGLLVLIFQKIMERRKTEVNDSYDNNSNDYYNSYSDVIKIEEDYHLFGAGLKALLFVQIFRFFKVTRIFGGSRIVLTVLRENCQILLTLLQIGTFLFCCLACVVYACDMDSYDSHFKYYSDAMYWALITLTTVGYGDSRPISHAGKAFACITAICGVVIYFLCPILLGVGIMKKLQEQRSLNERCKGPAASLIQSKWRIRRGGIKNHNIIGTILFMKLLAAQKKFHDVKKSSGERFTEKVSANSHELICATESRMILMEKSMATLQAKLDHLFDNPRN